MKSALTRRLVASVLTVTFLLMYSPAMTVMAAREEHFDDFESYTNTFNKDDKGYVVWRGASLGKEKDNQFLVLERTMPLADGENVAVDNNGTNARIAKIFDAEPAEKVLVSIDFKLPLEPSAYSAGLFGIMSKNSNKYSAEARLESGNLYKGRTSGTGVLRSDLKKNKWYNAFLILDLVNDKYQLICGDYESEEIDFEQKVTEGVDRFFGPRVRSLSTPIYFDNVAVVSVTSEALDVALYKAQSLLKEARTGYEDGDFPQTAYNMLEDSYEKIKANADSQNDTQRAAALNNAITKYKQSKIDKASADTTPCYILFDMPSVAAVSDEYGYTAELKASLFDKATNDAEGDILWSLDGTYDGVTIEEGMLKVSAGKRGKIVVKATSGDIYDTHEILLTEGAKVKSLSVDSRGGKISVSGKLSEKPKSDANISVNGNGIDISGKLSVDASGNFSFEKALTGNIAYTDISVKIEGTDTALYKKDNIFFYGTGWESKVLEDFNSVTDESKIENLVTRYSAGIEVNLEKYSSNKELFDSRIFAGITYDGVGEIQSTVKEISCLVDFSSLTASSVQKAIDDNILILKNAGFDKVTYDSMTNDRKTVFLAKAALLKFDKTKDSVKNIADKLNSLIENMDSSTGKTEGIGSSAEIIFYDDFESYEGNKRLATANYGLIQDCFVDKDKDNQYLRMTREKEYQSGETFGGDNNVTNARITKEFTEEPAEEIITSLDFMMPEDPAKYSAEIFGIMSDNGNYYATNILLQDGAIYNGRTQGTGKLAEGLKKGKWYNAFMYVDLVNNKYKLYFGDTCTALLGFQGQVKNLTNRLFMLRVRNYGQSFYADNVDISEVKHLDLATALYSAKSLLKNCEVGYENGQYPETAYNMLKNTYETMVAQSTDDMTEAQADLYAESVNKAIDNFKGNKIDTSGVGGKASYIKFDLPKAWGVDDTSANTYQLKADVYDNTNKLTSLPVTYSFQKNYEGVSVEGSELRVKAGTRKEITIIAHSGDVYDTHTLLLTSCKKPQRTDIDSRNGEISITGKLTEKPKEDVTVKVEGTSADLTSIDFTGKLTVNDDATFSYTKKVAGTLPFGFIKVTLEGNDTPKKVYTNVPFYGVGWENAVKDAFNGALSREELAEQTEIFYVGAGIDYEEYLRYKEDYNTRLFGLKPYKTFNDLAYEVKNLRCVTAFYEADRTNIENVFKNHIDTLVRNGFNKTDFDSFDIDKKGGVYTNAVTLKIDTSQTTAKDIAKLINDEITKIKNNNQGQTTTPSPSPSPSPGSPGGNYQVSLKKDDNNSGENNAEGEESLEQFKDISLAPWAADAFLYMRKNKIMVGDGENVRPVDAVTRGEFSKILAVAFALTKNGEASSFTDGSGAWWNEYAEIMNANGIMNGIGDGTFGGEMNITRQMLAVTIDRIIKAKGIELYKKNEGVVFEDEDAIADYAKEAVKSLASYGVVQGVGNGLFAPELSVKRAEAAQIIYNVLSQK